MAAFISAFDLLNRKPKWLLVFVSVFFSLFFWFFSAFRLFVSVFVASPFFFGLLRRPRSLPKSFVLLAL